jgi:DNA-binding Xre family transcriptional regulator
MSDVAYIGPGRRDERPRRLLRTTLGDTLRRIRLAQGRTLADVARAALISMGYLSELERGRKEASSEILAAICEALRVELSDVLTEVGRDLAKDRRPVPQVAGVQMAGVQMAGVQMAGVQMAGVLRRRSASPPVPRSGDVVLRAA